MSTFLVKFAMTLLSIVKSLLSPPEPHENEALEMHMIGVLSSAFLGILFIGLATDATNAGILMQSIVTILAGGSIMAMLGSRN